MVEIITDTREQSPLVFPSVPEVSVVVETVDVGDYTARIDGVMSKTRIERKSIADLFGAFSSGYDNEKKKIEKAKGLGLRYILAIEGTRFDVRAGHEYRKGGEYHRARKDGLSQIKQIITMHRKGYFWDVWFCASRAEMAFYIQEFFLNESKFATEGD